MTPSNYECDKDYRRDPHLVKKRSTHVIFELPKCYASDLTVLLLEAQVVKSSGCQVVKS